MTDTPPSPPSPEPPDPREAGHVPVLCDAVLQLLDPKPGQVMLDCTIGRGGHAAAIMPRLAPGGRYVGLDLDADNLTYVRNTMPDPPVPLDLLHGNFAHADRLLESLGVSRVDLLLADLGFASTQVDDPSRGFGFRTEGPLDMRLDRSRERSAADLLNTLPEAELARIIWEYGEERFSRRIARKIVESRRNRPMKSTAELASLCAAAYGPAGRRQRIHPATRTFQALRIAVNDELAHLEALLDLLPRIVSCGGRAAVISFHSLEDRRVKHTFAELERQGKARRVNRKPLTADEAEVAMNPRSRSAKIRAIEMTAS